LATTSFFRKYLVLFLATTGVFMNFIACGAQMYKVSMENDFPEDKVTVAAKDPQSPYYGIHALRGWVDLPIKFTMSAALAPDQQKGLVDAMKTWERAIGKQLFDFSGQDDRDGDYFPDLYSSLTDFVNGHYKDYNWDKTGKDPIVLATTIWNNNARDSSIISTADIRYNSQHYIIGDSLTLRSESSREVVDMESLALHELGHLLGLAHVSDQIDSFSIMNASLFIGEGLSSRRISRGDILRIQQIYGCYGEACDVDELVRQLEVKLVSSPKYQSVSQTETSQETSQLQ
jgi:hypothetical protein